MELYGGFPKLGVPFWGSPHFGKLPYNPLKRLRDHSGLPPQTLNQLLLQGSSGRTELRVPARGGNMGLRVHTLGLPGPQKYVK